MSSDLTALLGCVQSEVSHSDPAGRPRVYESCLVERVELPRPLDGLHIVAVICQHCQQSVRVQVRSPRVVRRKRLVSQLALAASVCLWVAALALALLYLFDQYPAAPGREVLLAGILVLLGALLWRGVDGQAAFAGDVAAGCTIERTPVEKAWAKNLSPGVVNALPRHVLLDPGQELAAASSDAAPERTMSPAWRKPVVTSTTVTPVSASPTADHTRRAA